MGFSEGGDSVKDSQNFKRIHLLILQGGEALFRATILWFRDFRVPTEAEIHQAAALEDTTNRSEGRTAEFLDGLLAEVGDRYDEFMAWASSLHRQVSRRGRHSIVMGT